MLAAMRIGSLGALPLMLLGDRRGRRRMLLLTLVGYAVLSAATGLTRGPWDFLAVSIPARAFLTAHNMLAIVIVAEELRAEHRGWGIGILISVGSMGGAIALVFFSMIEILPYGWRALYVIGAAPLLLVPWLARSLGETRRFASQAQATPDAPPSGLLRPLADLARVYPKRAASLAALILSMLLILDTSLAFLSKFLQEDHGMSPGRVALFFAAGGILSPVGNLAGGALGDRFGRKRMLAAGGITTFVAIAVFYNLPFPAYAVAFGALMFSMGIVFVILNALGAELFPTSYRSTANGAREVVSTMGSALGLWLAGLIFGATGSYASALTWLLVVAPIPLVAVLFLPETARQELEEVSSEGGSDAGPGGRLGA